MRVADIMLIQRTVGVDPDGFWGPVSSKACQNYLRDLMPRPHPFPPQSRVPVFYGPHGERGGYTPPTKRIAPPFTLFFEGDPVKRLFPHEKCAESLSRVFQRLDEAYPDPESKKEAGIYVFDGLYNPRKIRGGATSWSMHSWAIAIDINSGPNGLFTHWPTRAQMPFGVMECFAREGWLAAGAFWNRDAMHFQATST